MGIDAGFDMVPRLTTGTADKKDWEMFLDSVATYYQDDDKVVAEPYGLRFKVGEHPVLPFEGHKFLRFSSKISGRDGRAEDYILIVSRIAKRIFGPKVYRWREGGEMTGYYGWAEVNESIASYGRSDKPEISTLVATTTDGVDASKDLDLPLFEIKAIPGKGRGLVARVNIAKGTRIILEKPILTSPNLSVEMLETILASKLKSLSKVEQRQFLSLHNNFPGQRPFSGIMRTNALPCGSGSTTGAVYPTICLINHSCLPNSHNNWNKEKGHETIHAIHPILAGEEILLPYNENGPSSVRQAKLQQSFGFRCDCSTCSLPAPELRASDARRIEIQRLDDAIGDPSSMRSTPGASLAKCYSLLQVLEEEFRGSPSILLPRVQYDAFQISIAHGDQARAAVFAENAYKGRLMCEGEDSPDTQRMKAFMQNPASHTTFGVYSMRWRSAKNSVPKGLDTDELKRWLWKQSK
ncbi:hypothetical protein AK830_g2356 [Neonectria ditissima]|uniref:SET domain-containing protein n=1 Tax=Neonectria ditissima TaxID=78410 RepID=A0A0P7BSC6_9HYPO|nr:hypothetical protein AK830_g2356 [Neonectria ditissima]